MTQDLRKTRLFTQVLSDEDIKNLSLGDMEKMGLITQVDVVDDSVVDDSVVDDPVVNDPVVDDPVVDDPVDDDSPVVEEE